MASDRIVKVREQGRMVLRGLTPYEGGVRLDMDHDEVLDVTIDWSGWLNTDTIASVTNEQNAASFTAESNTSTTATLTLRGYAGTVEHRITTAAGLVKELTIHVGETSPTHYDGRY